jgi:hypothetical protein
MAAIGPISAVQRVTRVRIGTGRAHDGLPGGVALHHHFIGESGPRQAKKGCHCRCSDVRDFAHQCVSFDKIRSSSRSRQWPYDQPSAAGYRIDHLTNGIEVIRTVGPRCRKCSRRRFEKCLAGAHNDPISLSYAHGLVEGNGRPMLSRVSRCLRGCKFRTRSKHRDRRSQSRRI